MLEEERNVQIFEVRNAPVSGKVEIKFSFKQTKIEYKVGIKSLKLNYFNKIFVGQAMQNENNTHFGP